MAKQVQVDNIKGVVKSSRIEKLKAKQDAYLASKGLKFEDVFSQNTIKFGSKQGEKWQAIIKKAIDTDKIEKVLIANGADAEFAKLQVANMIASFNPSAGLNEAIRTFAEKKHSIPADFWDTTGNTSTPANVETADII